MKRLNRINLLFLFLFSGGLLPAQPKLIGTSPTFTNVRTTSGIWSFNLYPGDIIAATFTPDKAFRDEQVSDAVIASRVARKPQVRQGADALSLSWTSARVEVTEGGVTFRMSNGKTIRLLRTFYDSLERGFTFSLDQAEMIFGAGERSLPQNRRGYLLPLHNNPWYGYSLDADALNYSVPFIVSSNRYGIFFDNPSSGKLDIGKTEPDELRFIASSGRLTCYLVPGNDPLDVVQRYHRLTGTQPLPPRWALGNFMSRFGYLNENQVQGILDSMKAKKIPVDAIIFDLFWFGDSIKHTMGNLDWVNRKAWPDPAGMIRRWKKENIKTILITEPFVLKTSRLYDEARNHLATDSAGNPYTLTDFYFGLGGLIDIFRSPAQDWFYSKYRRQIDIGVEGWWGDLGEPEKHPANMYHNLESRGYFRKFSANEVHNMYGHQWSRMLFEKYRKDFPRKRLFHLNRSGYAGTPRFSSFPWSGDVSRSWNGMKAQIPLMLGMSMSGVPYIHSDAGGFAGGDGDAELFVRWLQFAAFTPVFRPHGTALGAIEPAVKDIPSEAALWPEPTVTLARKAILNRYEWLPYNYTLAYEQSTSGKPLMRPMFTLNAADSNLYKASGQYMWGEYVMVVPVTDPGVTEMTYYLPEGYWTRRHDGKRLKGGAWYTDKEISAADIPVWIKEGSFIPTSNGLMNTTDYEKSDLEITYYPSEKPSKYQLYEDDGEDAEAINRKRFSLTTFSSSGLNKNLEISISRSKGQYADAGNSRRMYLVLKDARRPEKVTLNGVASRNYVWDESSKTVRIPVSAYHGKIHIAVGF